MSYVEAKVDRLEDAIMRVLYIQQKNEIEIKSLKDEMKEFKDEMKEFKNEMKQENKRMNKKWGEISNKLGSIVEDIISPAVSPVIKEYFHCEVSDLQVRRKIRKNGLNDEFDVIAISDECNKLFLIEVKATPRVEYITDFKNEKIDRFRKLLPEYSKYEIVPIFASLRLESDMINFLTKNNIYAMAYKEWEYMAILN